MRNVLLSAVCLLAFVGASTADVLVATDMAALNVGSPDTPDPPTGPTMCNKAVLIYRFDMTGVIAADGPVAAMDGDLMLRCQWNEAMEWEYKAIATSADFDETTVTWNNYTGSAADMGYWDAMTPEDTQAFVSCGNFEPPQHWAISQAVVQSWADAGGIATVALVRASAYHNTCHWTTLGWDGGQLPKLDVTFIPEPATLIVVALGGLAVLRRRR